VDETPAMRAFAAGVELLRNHRIEEALSAFQIGLTNDTSDEDAGALLYNIAVCQERLGRSEPAPRAIEEALRRRPPLAADVTTDLDFDLLRTKEPLRSHLRDLHLVTRRSPLLTIGLSFLYGILLGLPWGHIFAELLSSSSEEHGADHSSRSVHERPRIPPSSNLEARSVTAGPLCRKHSLCDRGHLCRELGAGLVDLAHREGTVFCIRHPRIVVLPANYRVNPMPPRASLRGELKYSAGRHRMHSRAQSGPRGHRGGGLQRAAARHDRDLEVRPGRGDPHRAAARASIRPLNQGPQIHTLERARQH